MNRYRILAIGGALLALPACGTDEVSPRPYTVVGDFATADGGSSPSTRRGRRRCSRWASKKRT